MSAPPDWPAAGATTRDPDAAARRVRDARRWAVAYAALVAVGGAVLWLAHAALRDRTLEALTLLLLGLSAACQFCPLPGASIILWATRHAGPVPVALVASAGTCIANLHDYHLVGLLRGHRRLAVLGQTKAHSRAVAWFRRAPFLALAVATFLPLPIDAVRLLAAATGYPRRAYVLATFVGRFPRYLLLAILGHELRPSNGVLAAIAAVLLAAAAGGAVSHRLRARRGREDGAGR